MQVEGCQVEVAEVTPHPEEQAMAVATTVEAKAEDKARSRASSTARRVVCAKKACCPVLNAAPAFNRGVAEAAMQAHNLTDWAGLSSSMVQHRLCELGVHVQYSDAEALLRKQRRGVARDNLALLAADDYGEVLGQLEDVTLEPQATELPDVHVMPPAFQRGEELSEVPRLVNAAEFEADKFFSKNGLFQLFVKNLHGKTTTMMVSFETETVEELKTRVLECDFEGLLLDEIYLSHEGKVLVDEAWLLSEYGIKEHSTVHMHLRVRGGMDTGVPAGGGSSQMSEASELQVAIEISMLSEEQANDYVGALVASREEQANDSVGALVASRAMVPVPAVPGFDLGASRPASVESHGHQQRQ